MLPRRINILVVMTVSLILAMLPSAHASNLSPGLQKAVAAGSDSTVEVVIFLDDDDVRKDALGLSRMTELTRGQRIKSVVSRLRSYSAPNKSAILGFLAAHATGTITEHWIIPAVRATLPLSAIETLSEFDGVKLIVENVAATYEPPAKISSVVTTSTAAVSTELVLLGVPELWKQGLNGKGRLVCSFDTGVEHSHPALASKWRGNHAPLTASWFSKIAPDAVPYDPVGHGTHTMGIMLGSTDADSFGVAPEAEWITAGIIDVGRTLSLTISDIIEAFQWSLNPDGDENTTDDVPDVILNSWGFPKGLFTPCDNTFWGMIDYVEAAGIVTIFSAGNEGPDPQTIRHPADRASTPINAFAVGAVDNTLTIAEFSSRGPSSCDNTQIKPEVVAPGVNIRSSTKGGGYVLMSGTSQAAPYLAGLVALIRQYNPNVTVEQIKNAYLMAAVDLGVSGEDNTYGHGFVNAARVLDYIPAPNSEELKVVAYSVSGDGIADPGEEFELQLTLSSSIPGLESATGTVVATCDDGVVTGNSTAVFEFGPGGTVATNALPFDLYLSTGLYNGQPIPFKLGLSATDAGFIDTLDFILTVGIPPRGEIATHDNSRIRLTVSDFGQFGFAPGSIYDVDGDGLCVDDNDNVMYEAGLVLATTADQLVTAIRDEQGQMKVSDFAPVRSLTDEWLGPDAGTHRMATFTDASGILNVSVTQETVHFDDIDEQGYIMLEYRLTNNSLQRIFDLRLGLFVDLDMSSNDETVLDNTSALLYQTDGTGRYVGVVGIKNTSCFSNMLNDQVKTGFTESQLHTMLSDNSNAVDESLSGDLMFMASSVPLLVEPRQTAEIVFAVVVGYSLDDLYHNVAKARSKFEFMASLEGAGKDSLPDDVRLYQNFPNPFNPVTTISFSVFQAGHVSLDIVNVLGQKVRTVYSGNLSVGLHRFQWDGTNEHGDRVASGIYLCRLSGESTSQSRKMLLVK
ncbi:MAG: S8 family serine peptidase [Candidatus Zixiibacteriota bacterium]|nr:MAG: S8 family serine peptidase [candidate division Zixibacteria bacterium]